MWSPANSLRFSYPTFRLIIQTKGSPVPIHPIQTTFIGVLTLVAALLITVGEAHAEEPVQDLRDGQAWFEGEVIDLADSWGEAQACLVWRAAGRVECFRTVAEMDAVTATVEAAEFAKDPIATQSTQCLSWLYLYEFADGGGRTVQFRDRGYWQNLSTWGFNNVTSSFRTGACSVSLAEGSYGSGAWYPGTTSAYHYESRMVSGWDNRVSSLRIN